MDYFEAQALIQEEGVYTSADFYRMSLLDTNTFAIALRDIPQQIFYDLVNHGTDEAKLRLQEQITEGVVVPVEVSGTTFYEVCDLEMGTACPLYAMSHIAMQIAYPDNYVGFFDGEFVATYNHPKMQELVDLSISCMTNKAHPSDIYGQHEIPKEKTAGRPKSETSKAQCGKKQEVAEAWVAVEEAIAARDDYIERLKAWRTVELDKLRAAMKAIGEQYKVCEADAKEKVRVVRQVHRDLKDS